MYIVLLVVYMCMYNVETALQISVRDSRLGNSSCARLRVRFGSPRTQLANRFSWRPLPACVSRPHPRPSIRPRSPPCRDTACAPHWTKWNIRSAQAATWRHMPAPAVYPKWDPTLLFVLLGIPNRVVVVVRERERDVSDSLKTEGERAIPSKRTNCEEVVQTAASASNGIPKHMLIKCRAHVYV